MEAVEVDDLDAVVFIVVLDSSLFHDFCLF